MRGTYRFTTVQLYWIMQLQENTNAYHCATKTEANYIYCKGTRTTTWTYWSLVLTVTVLLSVADTTSLTALVNETLKWYFPPQMTPNFPSMVSMLNLKCATLKPDQPKLLSILKCFSVSFASFLSKHSIPAAWSGLRVRFYYQISDCTSRGRKPQLEACLLKSLQFHIRKRECATFPPQIGGRK